MQGRGQPPAAHGVEELLKVERLRRADDIPDFVRAPLLHAMLHSCHVGGRIAESPIGLLNHKRRLVGERGHVVEEDALRAIALAGEAGGL